MIVRGKFPEALEKAFREGRLKGKVSCLGDQLSSSASQETQTKEMGRLLQRGFRWLPEAYDYLSRYTHRVAISNHRLTRIEGKVSFRARDNSRPGHQRS